MFVLDEEPYLWLLLEDAGVLYLNVFCSHSAVDYFFLISLDDDERRLFEKQGRSYLNRLAQDIHSSAPAVRGSQSRYKARGLTQHWVAASKRPWQCGRRSRTVLRARSAVHPAPLIAAMTFSSMVSPSSVSVPRLPLASSSPASLNSFTPSGSAL